jgi:DNA polymerase-1
MKTAEGKKRLVLLDAHAILHRAYHALPDFASSKGEPTGALYGLSTMLMKIIAELKPDYLVACYDLPKPTYRHEAYKDYKAGRAKADEALVAQMKRSRDVFKAFHIPIYDKEGFEADDMIGTIVEQMKNRKDIDVVIASGDMDTLQLVNDKKVQVYTLKKGINDTILYDEDGVNKRFGFGPKFLPDYKGLRGDPSDNIPGIKGIGEVTATVLIKEFGSIEDMYKKLGKDKEAFLKAGIKPRIVELLEKGKEEAEFSKMLGTIRRDAPIECILPEKVWKETIVYKDAEQFFTDLEFRMLGTRLKEVLFGKQQPELAGVNFPKTEKEKPVVDKKQLEETGVALWVINSNLTNPKLEDVLAFAKTESFEKAREIIFTELKKKDTAGVYEKIEKPLMSVVESMDTYGVKIDTEFLKKLSKEYHQTLSGLEKEIWKLAGEEFNVASPKQLGEILFVKLGLAGKRQKKTATGAFSTKESELAKLKDTHPIISLILEYRELAKLLGTYIDTIPNMVDKTSRLHAHFLQAGAATGRMASENPGLQNIPVKTELGRVIRKGFIAEKGYELVAFDYSQVELRIAAFLANDIKLIEIFKNGEDIHTAVASEVFKVPKEKVDKEMRRRAKVINFGIMYGMGVTALQGNLGTNRVEAQKFYNDYFETFSGLAKYLDEMKAFAYRTGYTETFFGRRRYFEGIKSKLPFIRAAAERMAINAPIQGTEADLIKIAMIDVDEYLKKEKLSDKVHLILQVHDELVYEIESSLVKKIAPKIKDIMEGGIAAKERKDVPIVADVSVGKNWGEMEKLAF